jgi:FkbM family methyltransferase
MRHRLLKRIRRGPKLIQAAQGKGRATLALYLIWNLINQVFRLPACSRELDLSLSPGIQVAVDTFSSQLGAYLDIFPGRVYGQLPGFIGRSGQVIVDAGAHVGFYALWQGLSVGPTGRIYAFEPNPAVYPLLVKNVRRNGLDWVECIPQALSAEEGMVVMQTPPRGTSSARILHSASEETEPTVQVQSTTLDAFVDEHNVDHIDILKMDTEGAEVNIVLGGLLRALPVTKRVVMESHGMWAPGSPFRRTREPVCELLACLDFRPVLDYKGGKIVYFERELRHASG